MHLGVMADHSIQSGGDAGGAGGAGGGGNPTSSSTSLVREYRKGNWTVSETMILIEAKKMDDERRMKRTDSSSSSEVARMNKPAELRWKWVEDYCWRKGCLRSQNQCNDKWDNLMRDYKKVRDYERKRQQQQHQQQQTSFDQDGDKFSYWKMEKNERKDKMLPTNMLPQIYEALVEVVEKRVLASGSSSVSAPTHPRLLDMTPVAAAYTPVNLQPQQPPPPPAPPYLLLPRQHISSTPSPTVTAVVSSPTPIQQVHPVMLPQSHPTLPTVDSDTSEHSDSPAKRRRRSSDQHHHQEQQGMASASPVRNIDTAAAATLSSSPTTSHEVASAISRSASVIAEALLASNEREERRHRDLLNLQERRLKIEESKTEVNRQGINGLVDAISKLANSIQALASNKHGSSPSSSRP